MIAPRHLAEYAELQSRFFDGLAAADVCTILAAATERRFLARSVIINQGTPAREMFMLAKGRARYSFTTPEGRKLDLFWVVPGEILGGMALVSKPASYLVSTEAVKDTTVVAWDRQTIRRLAARYARLLENALCIAADYLDLTLRRNVALSCYDAERRLAEILTVLARVHGHQVPGGVQIDVTNEELANAANITPFTASRLMSQWRRRRALSKSRGKVVLRAPDRLFGKAE
jgi:CRP-like cAMP-binding protein